MSTPNAFDVWLMRDNTVYKGVPFDVVADWVQQARLGPDDKLKPSGAADWAAVAESPLFVPYLLRPEPQRVEDAAEVLEPVELDLPLKRRREADDDDFDMIPLIYISLVLLIFFMMTTTVVAISRVAVPEMANASNVDPSGQTLVLYLDQVGAGQIEYAIAKGVASPAAENSKLSEREVLARLDEFLAKETQTVKVRIAAHQDLAYELVDRIMKELDRRQKRGAQIEYTVEVGERTGK